MERRKSEHERKEDITCEHFNSIVYGHTREAALELEDALAEEGFAKHKDDLRSAKKTATLEYTFANESLSEEKHHVYVYYAVEN